MSWQPEGWSNPYILIPTTAAPDKRTQTEHERALAVAYEEGADALLAALRKTGTKAKAGQEHYLTPHVPAYRTKGRRYLVVPHGNGCLVFIPDDPEASR